MGKSAIVFGGAGFIGSHLLAHLKASGEYTLLVSADCHTPRFTVPGVRYRVADVREPIPDETCPDATEIYNLAAVHITPGHQDWEYYWTNVMGAVNVCDFARRTGARSIVFTSSIAVYGATEEIKDDESETEPDSAYGRSKLCAERIHHLWQHEKPDHRRLVVVRSATIYGHAERANFTRMAGLMKRRRFVFPGRADTIKACGYVKDMVRSTTYMLGRCEGIETYVFSHPHRYSTAELCAAFSRVGGFAPARLRIPLYPMLFGGWLFEQAARVGLKTSINRARVLKLVHSNNFEPRRLVEAGFSFNYSLDESLADWRDDSGTGEFD